MKPRYKKLIGMVVLLPAMGAYFLGAAALADMLPQNAFVRLAYFIVAGVVWVFPLKPFFRWINTDPSQKRNSVRTAETSS